MSVLMFFPLTYLPRHYQYDYYQGSETHLQLTCNSRRTREGGRLYRFLQVFDQQCFTKYELRNIVSQISRIWFIEMIFTRGRARFFIFHSEITLL